MRLWALCGVLALALRAPQGGDAQSSQAPTTAPTHAPTTAPTSAAPTTAPTHAPTAPTWSPTAHPTPAPTAHPTSPTHSPTAHPTTAPTHAPTAPTMSPTAHPTAAPTAQPTSHPTLPPKEYEFKHENNIVAVTVCLLLIFSATVFFLVTAGSLCRFGGQSGQHEYMMRYTRDDTNELDEVGSPLMPTPLDTETELKRSSGSRGSADYE